MTDFHAYLVTDAYVGYKNPSHVIRTLCWSHILRYMIESIPLDSSGKEIPGFKSMNELLAKALTYTSNQKKYLETFMEDDRIPSSNNLCETNIKTYATAKCT